MSRFSVKIINGEKWDINRRNLSFHNYFKAFRSSVKSGLKLWKICHQQQVVMAAKCWRNGEKIDVKTTGQRGSAH